ncbi:MAG TPA: DUF5652 family protein [Bacillota bacterium]|nr:DUF5652 family protein [Peptococcaceae bacterium MAG4]NLW37279.1 hypothetical protein [Peptococcaceae bacterium]HPZ44071.1 DUF5652 family protein [Bacillota bacterium]HQD76607.1 DUF5652 family protein [Bacillota bacterium]HUM59315.1 DUF5652 family protein [Bacillota bacterium]
MNNLMQFFQPDNPLFYLLITWAIVWKGIALWHAARNRQLVWYIALLIVNTVGILEILYLVFFRKKEKGATP